jgi:DNA-directed RNA polymerase specialized sigma24 family protein
MGEPQHDPRWPPAEHLPPLWIRARDSQGRPIDPRVIAVAEELWPWAYHLVQQELHDSASAAQLVEGVALKVSSRLHDEPSVNRNLPGYFVTAFRHQVHKQFLKENRVTYEGLLRELERNHHLTAPDWEAAMERELCLQILIDQLPDQSRHMLNFRVLGFSWKEIGLALDLSEKQARSRFYYELAKVHDKLLNGKAKGAGHSEESD